MSAEGSAPPIRPSGRDLRTVAGQGSLQFAGAIANAALAFLLVLVATRLLGASRAGAFLVGIGLFQILATLAQLGADTGLVRTIPRLLATDRSAELRTLHRIALIPVVVVGAALSVIVFLAAPQIAEWLSRNDPPELVEPFVRWFAPLIAVNALTSVATSAARGYGTVAPAISIQFLAIPASRPLLLTIAVGIGLGATGVAMSYALPILIGCVVALAWLERLRSRAATAVNGSTMSRHDLTREFWGYSWPRAIQAFLSTAILWIDVLLLAAMRSAGQAAVYTAASRFMIVGEAALSSIVAVISPQVSRLLASDDRSGARTLYQTSTWWLMTLTWPLLLSIAIFAPLLLSIFGPGFTRGEDALTILALAGLGAMATGPAGAVLLMAGHSLLGLIVGSLALTLNVSLNLVLIPRFGMTGAATAWATSILFSNLVAVVAVWRYLGMTPFTRGFAKVALAALGTYGAIGLLVSASLGTGLGAFVLYGMVATISYAIVLARFRRELRYRVFLEALRDRSGRRLPSA